MVFGYCLDMFSCRMDFIGEAMKKKLVSIFIVFSCITSCNSGIFDWFSPAKPKSKIEQLEEKLVNRPKDPEVNYNLGVAYYKEKKLNDAIQCFKRAFDYGTDTEIKKRSSFNAGNGLYQSVLAGLPHNWEKKETSIDPQLLAQSTMMAKDTVEQYTKTLSIDPVDVKAKTNKKKAEELLKKLQDKQQQKPQEKQDKQNKQDKQDKKDQQQQGDQSQQDQNQGGQGDKGNQSDQSEQEKNKGDHDGQNDQQQGKGKDEMKSPSEQQKEAGDKGLDKQESQQKQDTKHDHEKTPEQKEGQQQSPSNQDKSDQGKEQAAAAAGKEDQKNSEEKRALGAILDSLKDDEKGLQKGLMKRDMQKKQQKDPIKYGQKQW